jgi:hypothetical protein
MNIFVNIPVPSSNGSGAPVDMSALGYTKTVSVKKGYGRDPRASEISSRTVLARTKSVRGLKKR